MHPMQATIQNEPELLRLHHSNELDPAPTTSSESTKAWCAQSSMFLSQLACPTLSCLWCPMNAWLTGSGLVRPCTFGEDSSRNGLAGADSASGQLLVEHYTGLANGQYAGRPLACPKAMLGLEAHSHRFCRGCPALWLDCFKITICCTSWVRQACMGRHQGQVVPAEASAVAICSFCAIGYRLAQNARMGRAAFALPCQSGFKIKFSIDPGPRRRQRHQQAVWIKSGTLDCLAQSTASG